ncbi:ChaN family lipoprotein [Thiohalorhabdus denitrificans]|uniref:Uncharacterized iron-regulated protein n=1 Tax=Thiohalorhabdus denitrificans TaxID=381306 RepID=A0A1G5DIG5_9GAMM|nr:ChaN family lipoprotein [Thiohalorhabdus denitrificans]SCY14513.1 Uncharacterized iron-regulated protein [Thiohalorhabdus denitrificans]
MRRITDRGPLWAVLWILALLHAAPSFASDPEWNEGQIFRPASGDQVPFADMIDDLSRADVVLVGEEHDSRAHHRLQEAVIAALLGRGPVVVGMESFPSTRQDVLDAWWRGKTASFTDFLQEVRWFQGWSIDPGLYRDILEMVRMHRAPLLGINVPREWISRVAREGLDALGEEQRRRIGEVADPAEEYRDALRESLGEHESGHGAREFIEAQTAWDAAMAGGLLDGQRDHPEAVVVGIAGKGHLQGGYGIPHQLQARDADLEVRTVVPYDPGNEDPPLRGDADYAWPMDPDRASDPVRIGALLDAEEEGEGVAVKDVQEDSPADTAGLRAGDRILAVNGGEVEDTTMLIYAVRQQQWGGSLRLRIRREDAEQTLSVPLDEPEEGSAGGHSG